MSRSVTEDGEALLVRCVKQFNVAIGGDGSSEIDEVGFIVDFGRTIVVETFRIYHFDDVNDGAGLFDGQFTIVFYDYFHCLFLLFIYKK
jgi:hypothetical protein